MLLRKFPSAVFGKIIIPRRDVVVLAGAASLAVLVKYYTRSSGVCHTGSTKTVLTTFL